MTEEIRAEINQLYKQLRKVAQLASKRKLDHKERATFQRKLMKIASMLSEAHYLAQASALPLFVEWISELEVYILAAEEGEGKKLELPKHIGDIKIDRSKDIKILQQAGLIEKPSVFMQYWREIVIGILLILVLALLVYFIPLIGEVEIVTG